MRPEDAPKRFINIINKCSNQHLDNFGLLIRFHVNPLIHQILYHSEIPYRILFIIKYGIAYLFCLQKELYFCLI